MPVENMRDEAMPQSKPADFDDSQRMMTSPPGTNHSRAKMQSSINTVMNNAIVPILNVPRNACLLFGPVV